MKRLIIIVLAVVLSVGGAELSAQGNLFKQLGKMVEKEVVSGVKQGVRQGINSLKNKAEQSRAQKEQERSQAQYEQSQAQYEQPQEEYSYTQSAEPQSQSYPPQPKSYPPQPQSWSEQVVEQQPEAQPSAPRELFVQTTLPQFTPPSKQYAYDASAPTTGRHFHYYWVDLGLPSGVKWSSTNYGSARPENVGNFKAWASFGNKVEFSREQYEHMGKQIGDISGDLNYDIVRKDCGRGWRIPSVNDFAELVANCDREYVQQNGVYGVKFVSRINGQSIFLPVTGYKEGWNHNSKEVGMYWLSTPNSDNASSYMFKITPEAEEYYFAERHLGFCLRPVLDRLEEEKVVTKGSVAGHDWVDMGLPSGTRWATCNVDASKPSQPGKHYAWGETTVKSSYTEANSKYNGKTVEDIAGTANDVAAVKWGNGWRMPTREQMAELVRYSNWDYVQLDGRWVVRLTSFRNNEVIYLPATGMMDGTKVDEPNGCGNYWTSTPSGTMCAHDYIFGAALGEMGQAGRYYGFAVRPVLNKASHIESPVSGSAGGHDWVDLALPSGTKWATCNIGATAPDQDGGYFAWGEVTTAVDVKAKKNEFFRNMDVPRIVGNPNCDAAAALWGSEWRMPSKAQWQELVDNCTWEWVTMCGRGGYKVKSKHNQNWIFISAAGQIGTHNTNPYGQADYVDVKGYYWTSDPVSSDYDSYRLSFTNMDSGIYIGGASRGYGYPIRPVLSGR